MNGTFTFALYVVAGAVLGAAIAGALSYGLQGLSTQYIGWGGVFLKISRALIAGGLLGGLVPACWREVKRISTRIPK